MTASKLDSLRELRESQSVSLVEQRERERAEREAVAAPVTAPERKRLAVLESKIEAGLASFVEVGLALTEIREGRLYRETHGTFESYCRARWSFSDRRGRQLIEAANVAVEVGKTGTVVPVSNTRQARELAPLVTDPGRMREALEEAAETGPPTARSVRRAVAKRLGKPEPRRPLQLSFSHEDALRAAAQADDAQAALAVAKELFGTRGVCQA